MPRQPGEKLGPYEILELIGKGGMGEVYRARDSRLNRDVAIKTSAAQFSERFEREAKAIAALNHPNICQLYDVGPNYLVMEYIEGEAPQGPLPLEDVLRITRQIADALEAAHEKGITHRDLKPGNIKIKPDGTVKVLDFGLAKVEPGSAVSQSENSPTLSMAATQMGVILGTAGYMSPEQARGKPVDKRADIWAFGVVFYELLVGKRLFQGEDVSHTMAAVIMQEPNLDVVPVQVRKLLQRCLEKDPKKRLRDISGVELLLESGTDSPAQAASLPQTKHTKLWAAAVAVLVAAVGIALWAPWRSTQPLDHPLARLDVDLGADVSLPAPTGGGSSVVISPDGTRLVYVSDTGRKLFTRRLDQLKATELPGTQGAQSPFFSPDGEWVGFAAGGKLSRISVEGGAVVPLADVSNFSGASWGEDGTIVFGSALGKGLLRVPAGGGPSETIAGFANGELSFETPQLLPGGKAVLLSVVTSLNLDNGTIEVLTLADRRRKVVARGGASPRYLATSAGAGHLVYTNKATLFAVPFDLDKLTTRGTAIPLVDDLAYHPQLGNVQMDFSATGTLLYRRNVGGVSGIVTAQWVDATRKPTGSPNGGNAPLRAKPGIYGNLSLSPDGKRVALTVTEGGNSDLWVYDPQRDAMTRLTFGGGLFTIPVWSPDGKYVLFSSIGTSVGSGIFQVRADGASQPQALTQTKTFHAPRSFTPDGKRLAYMERTGNYQLWTLPLEEEGKQLKAGTPEQFLKSNFSDQDPSFSPDGRWLAYQSNESGKNEVYVRAFPPPSSGQGGKWQISNNGGTQPHWSRSSHELVYRAGNQLLAASYTVKADSFVADKPRVWIDKLGGTEWDLAPDGKRVAVLTPVESTEAPKQDHEIVMLLNFFDELRRKVPAGK